MASSTDKKLDRLAEVIEKLVNKPVPVAPIAPIAPIAPVLQNYSCDHDLLTKLDTKVDQIQLDVTELKKDRNVYVTQPELNELGKLVGDHEKRVRSLESQITRIMTWGSVILVGLTIVQIYLKFYGK